MSNTPYLQVVGMPREMGGRGAPKPTVFGVLGHTKYDSYSRTLGGLISDSKTSGEPVPKIIKAKKVETEHHLTGKAPATHIPGAHYGQVPYAGKYMSDLGKKVSH